MEVRNSIAQEHWPDTQENIAQTVGLYKRGVTTSRLCILSQCYKLCTHNSPNSNGTGQDWTVRYIPIVGIS